MKNSNGKKESRSKCQCLLSLLLMLLMIVVVGMVTLYCCISFSITVLTILFKCIRANMFVSFM